MKSRINDILFIGILVLFVFVIFSFNSSAVTSLDPEIVLINGKIITVNKGFDMVEAVAIQGNKFIAVGTNEEIQQLIGSNTEIIDLEGKTVTPGFIDGHAHMDREGLKFVYPALTTTGYLLDPALSTVEEIVKFIENEVKKKQPGEWIVTMPIGAYPYFMEIPDAMSKTGFPTRWDLDKVSPDNPVYIRAPWYYWRGKVPLVSVANSKALELAGITKDTLPTHPGVQIVKDYLTGEPTGVFLEWNIGSIEFNLMKVVPRFTIEMRTVALKHSMERYNAVGITSIYEGHGMDPEVLRAYKNLWEKGEMTVRSNLLAHPAWDSAPEGEINEILRDFMAYAAGKGTGDEMLRLSGIFASVGKSAVDTIKRQERPYSEWAGYGMDQMLPPERGSIFDLYLAAAKQNIRTNSIGIGFIDVIEKVNEEVDITDQRLVLEHLNFITEAQQEKFKKYGVFPTFIIRKTVGQSEGGLVERSSEEMLNTLCPLKSLVDLGIPFSLCTDNVPIEILQVMETAVTRKHIDSGKVISPNQRISREEALKGITIYGAYLTFEEDIKGSIEVGKLADLVVLSQDIMTCPEDDIGDTEVLLTIVDGKIVHRK